jgi:hypothetical protein
MTDISLATMLKAIDGIVWYNCLGELLLEVVKDLDKAIADGKTQYIYPDEIFDFEKNNLPGDLQAVWMTCVEQFGDYGTSPRYGWINDLKGCRAYLLAVTYTYRCADYEYYGEYMIDLNDESNNNLNAPIDVWKREVENDSGI